jgi:hypothetical protein
MVAAPMQAMHPAPRAGWWGAATVRWKRRMHDSYAGTLSKVAGGRAATVERLRVLAMRLEQLPLEAAAEVLVILGPALASLERQAGLALERASRPVS